MSMQGAAISAGAGHNLSKSGALITMIIPRIDAYNVVTDLRNTRYYILRESTITSLPDAAAFPYVVSLYERVL